MRNLIPIWLFYYSWVIDGKMMFCLSIDLIRLSRWKTFQLIIFYWNFFHCEVVIGLWLSFVWVLSEPMADDLNWMRHIDCWNKSFENISCKWRWSKWGEMFTVVPSHTCQKNIIEHAFHQLYSLFCRFSTRRWQTLPTLSLERLH